ncbi:LPS translocon maturation chaperone LptM [Shewanella psychrotolerans]|uniref:LPS translocon maturation chaperone LptM n=1 Tax=Shewanella psychrotolerans TaxID=2864206 RepID=UPI0021ACC288|nr:lipoprotein [Shewanella psychrotolerans]
MKLISLVLLVGLSMVACGQKGPLYKTPEVQDNQSSQQQDKPAEPATTQKKD